MEKLRALSNNKLVMYILLGLFCIFTSCLAQGYDFSLFTNLAAGEYMVCVKDFTYQDLSSFFPTHIWINQQWISSICYYLFYKLFGVFGLVLIQAALLFFIAVFVIKIQKLQTHAYPTSICFIGLFLLVFCVKNNILCNPVMFSYLFFTIAIYLLEKTRLKNSNVVWLFPLLIAFWNNCHKEFYFGIALILIYILGSLFARKKVCFKYIGALLISIPMLLVTPYGLDYINFYPLSSLFKYTMLSGWENIFKNYRYIDFLVLIAAFLGLIMSFVKLKNFNLTRALLLVTSMVFSLLHTEFLSLTIIILVAMYYNDCMRLFSKKMFKYSEKLALVAAMICVIMIPFTHPNTVKININKIPVVEAEFLKQNNIKGSILCDVDFARYFSYKLLPDNNVFMDSRYDEVYYDEIKEDYDKFMSNNSFWFMVLIVNPIEIVVVDKNAEVCNEIEKENTGWKKIFTGPICNIYTIKSRKIKTPYIQPQTDIKYYQKNMFEKVGKFVEL